MYGHPAHTVLIVNPAAGNGRAGRAWPRLQRELEAAGLRFALQVTGKPGDASRLAKRAARSVQVEPIGPARNEQLLVQMDGEQPGRTPAEITVIPRALRVAIGLPGANE